MYTKEDVLAYVNEENVTFIRLPTLIFTAIKKIFPSYPMSFPEPLRKESALMPVR